MKKIAIFGDIHANLEALDAVLEDAAREGCGNNLACLGDIVGYNADPSACLEKVKALGCPTVKGNHDYEAISTRDLVGMNPVATMALSWTRDHLSEEQKDWLKRLPYVKERIADLNDITIVHATMDRPMRWEYILNTSDSSFSFERQSTPLCFHGHTHVPRTFIKDPVTGRILQVPDTEIVLEPGRLYFINPGSVGQPRDGDWRASYAVYTPELSLIQIKRVEYDIRTAQDKIRAAGLPDRLADRLAAGR